MAEATPENERAQPAAKHLAERIELLPEPYRSNAIEWLERWANGDLSDLDRDLSLVFEGFSAGPRTAWIELLGDVVDEAVRHFGAD